MNPYFTIDNIQSINDESILEIENKCNTKYLINDYSLYSGYSGYIIAILNLYENKKDNRLLYLAERLIFQDSLWGNNITLYYGVSGHILALLYYFYLSGDKRVLNIISKDTFYLLSKLRLYPNYKFMKINFNEGILGVLYILTLLSNSNERIFINKVIKVCCDYIREYILSENKEVEYSDILFIYNSISNKLPENCALVIKQFIAKIEPILLQKNTDIFKHILKLGNRSNIELTIDKDRLCKMQISYHFPRTIEQIASNFDFNFYVGESIDITSFNFAEKFDSSTHDSTKEIFSFEKQKFLYELELRSLNRKDFIKLDRLELVKTINALNLPDNKFLEQYFICPQEVQILKTSAYIPLEIEDDVLPAENYWIAIRPQTIPFDELYISECCLEDRFAILKTLKKINVPIKGIELLELVYNQDKSIHYDTAFKFVVDVLRKLLLFRLLTIDSGPRKALTE